MINWLFQPLPLISLPVLAAIALTIVGMMGILIMAVRESRRMDRLHGPVTSLAVTAMPETNEVREAS